MNCICRDLVQQGHGRLIDSFYHFSMLNNNCKIVIGKLLQ